MSKQADAKNHFKQLIHVYKTEMFFYIMSYFKDYTTPSLINKTVHMRHLIPIP